MDVADQLLVTTTTGLTHISATSILLLERLKHVCLGSERALQDSGTNSCLTFFSAMH